MLFECSWIIYSLSRRNRKRPREPAHPRSPQHRRSVPRSSPAALVFAVAGLGSALCSVAPCLRTVAVALRRLLPFCARCSTALREEWSGVACGGQCLGDVTAQSLHNSAQPKTRGSRGILLTSAAAALLMRGAVCSGCMLLAEPFVGPQHRCAAQQLWHRTLQRSTHLLLCGRTARPSQPAWIPNCTR